jgi:hypothetical protein
MFIVWWTGRGYLGFVVVLATMIVAGVLLAAVGPRLPDGPTFWGPVLVVAAAVNWTVGSRINQKTLAKVRPTTVRQRLLYRARNRLMSLPMESVSIPLAVVGVGMFIMAVGH